MRKFITLIGVFLIPLVGMAQEDVGRLIFKLEVNPSEKKVNPKQLSEFEPIESIKKDGLDLYYIGNYSDFLRAQLAQYELLDKGYKNVILIPFYNEREISMDDAYVLMDNRNIYDQQNIAPVSTENLDGLLRRIRRKSIDIKVEVELVNNDDINAFFDIPDSVDQYFSDSDGCVMFFSNFESFDEASRIYGYFQAKGLNRARIVAFQFGEEISLFDAIQNFEETLKGVAHND